MKKKIPTSFTLESATEVFVLCFRNDPMEIYDVMTQNPSDFAVAVGGKLRLKEGERDALPSSSGLSQQKLTLGSRALPMEAALELVEDVVEDFSAPPTLSSCSRYGWGNPSSAPDMWKSAGLAETRVFAGFC